MIDIDKKADLFGMGDDDGFAVMNDDKRDGFKAGAEWMREELTRWHDIRTEFPEFRQEVLLKMRMKKGTTIYRIGWLAKNGRYIVTQYARHAEVVAWRYIHE